ncbi:MAG TPA: polyprenyl synthetase family protein, partial [Thermodesulfovibrionales bacterium]|nr:polyprenyl synthetase family protein [Thermodesulfovibrionales bacterium]
MRFEEAFSSYADELTLVEKGLKTIFSSDALLLPAIGEHIVGGGGKRLRPLFLLLSADLAGYRGDSRVILASIIEAIHTASLLHDDVVDGAELRRGKQAAHMVWGNQMVILVGDFLYSNALRLAVLQKNQRIMETLSGATTVMTEGEILQLHRIADPEITEPDYYKIISAKTGALISAACRIGAILGGLSQGEEDALGRFGMKTGIVFQMADDILDYMANEKGLGKKLGKDLHEGKITLPLIHLLGVAAD